MRLGRVRSLRGATSIGVAGWSSARIDDWEQVGAAAEARTVLFCLSFDDPVDADGLGGQNEQVARLIVALRDNSSSCQAILRAVAEKQGIVSERELDRLAVGSADEKLRVPAHLRGALCEIGLQCALAPSSLFEIKEEHVLEE